MTKTGTVSSFADIIGCCMPLGQRWNEVAIYLPIRWTLFEVVLFSHRRYVEGVADILFHLTIILKDGQ